eukprot:830889-Rhodomonas_salina.2
MECGGKGRDGKGWMQEGVWATRVGEVDHSEELLQVVLHGRAGEQHAAQTRQRRQRLVRDRLVVLQPARTRSVPVGEQEQGSEQGQGQEKEQGSEQEASGAGLRAESSARTGGSGDARDLWASSQMRSSGPLTLKRSTWMRKVS